MEEVMSRIISIIQSNGLIINIIVTVVVAWLFGDMAAVRTTRKFQKEDAKRARIAALQSLKNEVTRIQKLAEHNSQPNPRLSIQMVARMPVAAFETAFVSGEPGLAADLELLDAVTDYLTCADSINSLVDIYLAVAPSESSKGGARYKEALAQIVGCSQDTLPGILERLNALLQSELEVANRS